MPFEEMVTFTVALEEGSVVMPSEKAREKKLNDRNGTTSKWLIPLNWKNNWGIMLEDTLAGPNVETAVEAGSVELDSCLHQEK